MDLITIFSLMANVVTILMFFNHYQEKFIRAIVLDVIAEHKAS